MKLVIVDYGMGNISSIVSALRYIGLEDIQVSHDYEILSQADKLLLPGVGNFAMAIAKIEELGLDEQLKQLVVVQKKPILGICLGMQLLGLSSDESGYNKGLGIIPGVVEKFLNTELKVPHVGFNQVITTSVSRLYNGLGCKPDFYFTHSFRMNSTSEIGQSHCNYVADFVASFELGNIAGVQFHPELSQNNGLKLLKNFIELF
jgi:glutamine amidotransferase